MQANPGLPSLPALPALPAVSTSVQSLIVLPKMPTMVDIPGGHSELSLPQLPTLAPISVPSSGQTSPFTMASQNIKVPAMPANFFQLPGIPPLYPEQKIDLNLQQLSSVPLPPTSKQPNIVIEIPLMSHNNSNPYYVKAQEMIARVDPSWRPVFKDSINGLIHAFTKLHQDERLFGFYPTEDKLVTAFQITPLSKVRVVILGQDPYPEYGNDGMPRATGMSFSVRRTDTIPSSLRNIVKELERSVKGFVNPGHGDLTYWAQQGVLLLNTSLTVRPNTPRVQGEIWSELIKNIIPAILGANPKCIFVTWGKVAQDALTNLLGNSTAEVLEAAHPSSRNLKGGFIECDHFNKINKKLIDMKSPPIDWNFDPPVHDNLQICSEALQQCSYGYNPANYQTPVAPIVPMSGNNNYVLPTLAYAKANDPVSSSLPVIKPPTTALPEAVEKPRINTLNTPYAGLEKLSNPFELAASAAPLSSIVPEPVTLPQFVPIFKPSI